MKTKITAVLILFLVSIAATAQIDRSKQPKPGPAPKITLEVPGEFELPNGLKVLIVENHKLPRVSFTLRIDNKPITEGEIAGVSDLLGSMLGNGTTSISKDAFNEEIDFLGARLSFGSQSAFASSLSKYSNRILELMADAAINPLLTEEEFQKEKTKTIEGLKSEAKNVSAIANRVGSALSFGSKHPYGEFVTEESLNKATLNDVRAFYQKYFNPSKAYLVVVGDVDFETIQEQVTKHFSKWEKGIDFDVTVPEALSNPKFTQINFIDMPNAVQSNISLINNVDLKMNDADYHATLLANKIAGGGFNSYLNMNLREKHGYTYGARSNISANRYGLSRFTAGAKVRNAVTDSAVVQTLLELNRIKNEPVALKDLNNAKAKYVGDFVLALERPETVANYALNIKLNNLPKDFYLTYLEKINAVTVDDIKRVANKYFKTENARIVVVGKGSEVLENLEKTKLPISFYDTYANPVEKPVFSKPLPTGVTAISVIDNYIKAIGGKDNLAKVKSTFNTASMTITGVPMPLIAEIKATSTKSSTEISAQGMGVLMKDKWNGETGYREQQGQRMPLSAEEIAKKKEEKRLFSELYLDASQLNLESVVNIDGADAYKIKISKDGEDSFKYFDTKTGFLVKEEKTTKVNGKDMTSVVNYGSYSAVDGIQFPYSMSVISGPQEMTFNITNIKINEGVADEDFN